MADLLRQNGSESERLEQLRQIVSIDREAGPERSDLVRGVAAKSALELSEVEFERFRTVRLTQPFERSLQEKQRLMNGALEALGALVDYRVGEITAAATYYMAEVYGNFSQSLLESERPGDLAGAELADYEGVLEEEAFPFEEKAIAVHAKNLELMHGGVYNPWIEKSLARLAALMPGRYAKPEESSGPLAALDGYRYQSPSEPAAPPAPPAPPAASEPDELVAPDAAAATADASAPSDPSLPAHAVAPSEPALPVEAADVAPPRAEQPESDAPEQSPAAMDTTEEVIDGNAD